MKIAMIILGVIGALSALGGSIFTVIGGMAGTAAGAMAEKSDVAMGGAMIFWSGLVTVVLGVFALITSVVGGAAKKKNTTLTFGLATMISGLLNVYLFNWTSGAILAVAGLLGLIGGKDGEEKDKSIFKSGLFYFVMVIVLVFTVVAIAFRNGDKIAKQAEVAPAETKAELSATPSLPLGKKFTVDEAMTLAEEKKYTQESVEVLAQALFDECIAAENSSSKGAGSATSQVCQDRRISFGECMKRNKNAYECIEMTFHAGGGEEDSSAPALVSQTGVCETAKHHIVLDTSNPNSIIYRSWNKPKALTEKPDMEVLNGKVVVEGSGKCQYKEFRFNKGKVEFVIDDNIACTEQQPPTGATGSLWVFVAGEMKNHYWCQ